MLLRMKSGGVASASACARVEALDLVPGRVHDQLAVGGLGDASDRAIFVGELDDLACGEIHAKQVVDWIVLRRLALARCAVGAKDDLVALRVERVLCEVQVHVVARAGELTDGAPCLGVAMCLDL